jgi:hypothetical protein
MPAWSRFQSRGSIRPSFNSAPGSPAPLQKFVNYRIRLAVIGDISAFTGASRALRDFIGETNRGRSAWFVADLDELKQRLAAEAGKN